MKITVCEATDSDEVEMAFMEVQGRPRINTRMEKGVM
jgi:hypothetical protein